MNRPARIIEVFALLSLWTDLSIAGDYPFSVEMRGSYTTTSKVFFNPDAPSAFERNRFFAVDDVFGLGLDVRRDIAYNLRFGISVEHISASSALIQYVRDRNGQVFQLHLDDGYRLIPVEFSIYFLIPFSSERVKVYMGGGMGLYFGGRKVEAAGITTETLEMSTGFGIHVMSGVDYILTPILALRGELKFRDPQVESTSRFPDGPVEYEGRTILFDQRPFRSRINLDGITFNVGAVLRF